MVSKLLAFTRDRPSPTPTLFPPQERVTLLEVGLSIRWSRRVIIELRFSPDQSRQINYLAPRTGF
jgi:hypothetical protein